MDFKVLWRTLLTLIGAALIYSVTMHDALAIDSIASRFSLAGQEDCDEDYLEASVRKRIDSSAANPAIARAELTQVPTVSKPAQEIVPSVPAKPVWNVLASDKTLNATLSRWAVTAGWQLVWELTVDYAIDTQTSISGTFEEAVEAVVKGMESAEMPMNVIFYRGNHVLRIVSKGAQS